MIFFVIEYVYTLIYRDVLTNHNNFNICFVMFKLRNILTYGF